MKRDFNDLFLRDNMDEELYRTESFSSSVFIRLPNNRNSLRSLFYVTVHAFVWLFHLFVTASAFN